jgi:hypothetical protein
MDIKKALDVMRGKIEELEEEMYSFEFIIQPRAEADRKILYDLKEQHAKLSALQTKIAYGEDVSIDQVNAVIPKMFR